MPGFALAVKAIDETSRGQLTGWLAGLPREDADWMPDFGAESSEAAERSYVCWEPQGKNDRPRSRANSLTSEVPQGMLQLLARLVANVERVASGESPSR